MNLKHFKFLMALVIMIGVAFGFQHHTKADTSSQQIEKIKKAGVLKVGVKQDVPNFGYYSAESGDYEGMEIEIARKIAKSLGVKIEFTPVTAQTREAVMDNGQVDIVIATYTITPERQANYNFSTPYYTDEIGFLVNKSTGISSIKDLDGMTIGVAQGSTTKAAITEYANAHNLSFKFAQLGSYPELAISLYAKRIQAFSVDKSILSGYRSSKTKILDEGFNTQSYGIATKKSNTEVNDYINSLIAKWQKDGTLEKIYKKFDLTPATSSDN